MRTLTEVITLIEEARLNGLDARKNYEKAAESRYKKRVAWLTAIKLYLETNPETGTVITDRNRAKKLIESLEQRKPVPAKEGDQFNPEFKKSIKEFEAMYKLPKLRDQLKSLNFILNG